MYVCVFVCEWIMALVWIPSPAWHVQNAQRNHACAPHEATHTCDSLGPTHAPGRHQAIVGLVREKFDEDAAGVVSAMLAAGRPFESSVKVGGWVGGCGHAALRW